MTDVEDALRAHQLERARELRDLAALLEQEGLTPDAGPIRGAAAQCLAPLRTAGPKQPDAGARYWGYDLSELRIALGPQRHCRPRGAVTEGASGILSVSVEEYVPAAAAQVGDSWTHVRRLDTDFYVDVHHLVGGERLPLRSAWHIDTHLHAGAATHDVHPRFHFQSGGERLDELDDAIRAIFLPEAPRLPCAPVDAILASDFVLSHYRGEDWAMLQSMEPRYGRLRIVPMQRYWQPYFQTLSDGIGQLTAVPGGGAAASLIPNICVTA